MSDSEWLDVDLKQEPEWVEAYRVLRNRYCELLLTDPVDPREMEEWIPTTPALVHALISGSTLVGAYVIYAQRDHELALRCLFHRGADHLARKDLLSLGFRERKRRKKLLRRET